MRALEQMTKKNKVIQIRVSQSQKDEIQTEAKKRNITVTELLLSGYETLKEGKYIDFK